MDPASTIHIWPAIPAPVLVWSFFPLIFWSLLLLRVARLYPLQRIRISSKESTVWNSQKASWILPVQSYCQYSPWFLQSWSPGNLSKSSFGCRWSWFQRTLIAIWHFDDSWKDAWKVFVQRRRCNSCATNSEVLMFVDLQWNIHNSLRQPLSFWSKRFLL